LKIYSAVFTNTCRVINISAIYIIVFAEFNIMTPASFNRFVHDYGALIGLRA